MSLGSKAVSVNVGAAARSWADTLGIWASALCAAHCLVLPLVLALAPLLLPRLLRGEGLHRALAVTVAVLGGFALGAGFRRHRRGSVLVLLLAGLSLVVSAAWWGERMPWPAAEAVVTLAGSACLITAHRLNHTFCRSCACVGRGAA